jgi:hypothetical protein
MPKLNWSRSALAALPDQGQREEMTRLFEAYLRVAGDDALTGTILPLNLPTDSRNRYNFHARFTKPRGWVVETALKLEYREVRWQRAHPPTCND